MTCRAVRRSESRPKRTTKNTARQQYETHTRSMTWPASLLTQPPHGRRVRITCRLEFAYPSKARAEKVAKSLRVDDGTFIVTTVSGKTLIAEVNSDSFLRLLHTLEDYLSCLSVAEAVLRG